jgi:hypothetical protein
MPGKSRNWRSWCRRRLVTGLVIAASAAIMPLIVARPAYALGAGEACIFNAPTGAQIGNQNLGHVGWGIRVGPTNQWIYGATENPDGAPYVDVGSFDGGWHATGTAQQMLLDFTNAGYYHSAGYYTQYKCMLWSSSAVTAAKNEISLIETTGIPAGARGNVLYAVAGWNCMDHANAILTAYGITGLPSPSLLWAPNAWFNALPGGYIPLGGETWVDNNSGQYLDMTGASTAQGAYAQQWPYNGGGPNQWWVRFPDDGGYYRILNKNSDLCLGVQGGSTAWGARVVQWACNGNPDQEWAYEFTGSYSNGWPVYNIVNKNSGLCLGVLGASYAEGAEVVQWGCNGNPDQEWY